MKTNMQTTTTPVKSKSRRYIYRGVDAQTGLAVTGWFTSSERKSGEAMLALISHPGFGRGRRVILERGTRFGGEWFATAIMFDNGVRIVRGESKKAN